MSIFFEETQSLEEKEPAERFSRKRIKSSPQKEISETKTKRTPSVRHSSKKSIASFPSIDTQHRTKENQISNTATPSAIPNDSNSTHSPKKEDSEINQKSDTKANERPLRKKAKSSKSSWNTTSQTFKSVQTMESKEGSPYIQQNNNDHVTNEKEQLNGHPPTDPSDVLMYYNIVTTERSPDKRKVKARDFVTVESDEEQGSDEEFSVGSETDSDRSSEEEKEGNLSASFED